MQVMADEFPYCKFMNEHNYIILLRANFVFDSSVIYIYLLLSHTRWRLSEAESVYVYYYILAA